MLHSFFIFLLGLDIRRDHITEPGCRSKDSDVGPGGVMNVSGMLGLEPNPAVRIAKWPMMLTLVGPNIAVIYHVIWQWMMVPILRIL